jgi:glycosyltransferase involved in cell wall biosynthesis
MNWERPASDMPTGRANLLSETSGVDPIRVAFWSAWQRNIELDDLEEPDFEVTQHRRRSDWNLSRLGRLIVYLVDSTNIVRLGGGYDVTIVSSAGLETFIVALLWRIRSSKHRLVILDPIALRWRRLDRLFSSGMGNVDALICIRRGDLDTYQRRFRVSADRCHFAYMPVPEASTERPADPDETHVSSPFIYAAGDAHRDWKLLLRAAAELPYRFVVATQTMRPGRLESSNVEVIPQVVPAKGRGLMGRSTCVAMVLEDTDLACGPTIVLDALRMGKAVVAADANGVRDYVVDGVTGLLSAPGDHEQLAANLRTVMEDSALRRQMECAAVRFAGEHLGRSTFKRAIRDVLSSIVYRSRLPSRRQFMSDEVTRA